MAILETICGHDDLIHLNANQRKQLCDEIRTFLVDHISRTGGHLASNLGVVELSVALETVFDTKSDRLVFDVGHQSYVHKLLTGRQADFAGLRQFGGIAGFPKPSESICDAFVAGHASSSVSIALGMARARTLMNEHYRIAAVLGDGAATGGMAYEGLNDAGDSGESMLVILNDNEMSIDRNVGGLAKHLSNLRTKQRYLGMKARYRRFLASIPGGRSIYRITRAGKNWLKRVLLPCSVFENMGFTYFGPVDGHDVESLITLLSLCREMKGPVLVHVLTQKGRGYLPAQENPSDYHGVGSFDPVLGAAPANKPTFSQTFGETMLSLAAEDARVCAITAAMPGGTGLLDFKAAYPNRLFDVGIAEEHAVSMAGGLAKQGMTPVVALYSTFLQRSYDQILQDICMLKLHVVLAVDRAGLVGEDGETHHGVFDVGFLRHCPGMTLLAPASRAELSSMLCWAVKEQSGPVAIRYPRGGDGIFACDLWDPACAVVTHRKGNDIALVTYGNLVNEALIAAQLLENEGIDAAVIRLTQLSPLPDDAMKLALKGIAHALIMEEAAAGAGVYAHLACQLDCCCTHIDLGSEYVTHGTVAQLREKHGLDHGSIYNLAKQVLGR